MASSIITAGDSSGRVPSLTAALKPALWAGIGAGLGAAAVFGILTMFTEESRAAGGWYGFALGVCLVLLWRRVVDPQIEAKLEGHARANQGHSAKRAVQRWFVDIAVAALISLVMLTAEAIVEIFVGFVHKQIALEGAIVFLKSVIGPAATVFSINLAWLLTKGRSKLGAAVVGMIAGAVASGIIVFPISLYDWLHDQLTLNFLIVNTLTTMLFWGIAGYLGGAAIKVSKERIPFLAISLSLLALTTAWNFVFVYAVPAFLRVELSSDEVWQTLLLNFLRVFGWLAGLYLCPVTQEPNGFAESARHIGSSPELGGLSHAA
jgi:hypothetical protein